MRSRAKGKVPHDDTAHAGVGPEGSATSVETLLGPGSKSRRGEQPKDPVRLMLLDRIRERGLTIADLSRALKRNDAYMHQFIWRASPQWLREADRAVVCRMLDIPEALLRPPMPDTESDIRPRPASAPSLVRDQRDVPLFREEDPIDPGAAREWTHRLPGLQPGPIFALWIAQEHERFDPGALIHVHLRQPPRVGDQVVVLVEQRVVAIGELTATGRGTARLQIVGQQPMAPPAGASVYKIVAALYP